MFNWIDVAEKLAISALLPFSVFALFSYNCMKLGFLRCCLSEIAIAKSG